jgi:hypothetical protein
MPDDSTNHCIRQGIRLNPRARYRAVGEDGVLIHLDQGRVVVVNTVGLRIVEVLAESTARQDLVAVISGEFRVTADQAAQDIDSFLAELDKENLLESVD